MKASNLKSGTQFTTNYDSETYQVHTTGTYNEVKNLGYDMPELESWEGLEDIFIGASSVSGVKFGLNISWIESIL